MTVFTERPAATARDSSRLVSGGWARLTGVPGLLSFTPKFELVVSRLQAALTAAGPAGGPGPDWYAPIVPRAVIERAEYFEAFPHLLGIVHALAPETAPEAAYETERQPTDVVLAPAVCYGVYARLAGHQITEQLEFDAAGYCYRHEATSELGRFRSFRMREFVTVADAPAAADWRDSWMARTETLLRGLGLACAVVPASDPFFGPGGRFMRSSQVQQSLKFEFVVPVHDDDPGTAIASANCHKEHLGERFAIGFGDRPAHTACMAFGLERTALALIHAHGDDLAGWPRLG